MSCFFENTENGRQEAVLIFKRDRLIYDIENYAFIEGSILPKDTEPHNRHMVQDIGQEGNRDRAARVLDLSIARCKESLYPFTKHGVHSAVLDNKLREPEAYGIVLDLPADFSQTTLVLMERLIHEYLVCNIVADWMSITNPGKEESWKLKAESALKETRVCLNTRTGRVRRGLHPFG